MFRALFFFIVFVTLSVNIILLFATKDKPPDDSRSASTKLVSVIGQETAAIDFSSWQPPLPLALGQNGGRRLFLRSNDFYDYSNAIDSAATNSNSNSNSNSHSQLKPFNTETHYGAKSSASQLSVGSRITTTTKTTTDAGGTSSLFTSRPRDKGQSQSAGESSTLANETNQTDRLLELANGGGGAGSVREKSSNAYTNDESEPVETLPRPPSPPTRRRPSSSSANTLAVRVKSSKNHVLITADNLIIYESGAESSANQKQQQQHDGKATKSPGGPFNRRRAARTRRPPTTKLVLQNQRALDKNANSLDDDDDDQRKQSRQSIEREKESGQLLQQTTFGRGLHVLVLNQFEGFVMSQRLFDTYTPLQDDELALFLGQVQPGRLVVMAVQDEASFKMARWSRARKLIASSLGSRQIMKLDWRDMWALVAVKRPDDQLDSTNRALGEPKNINQQQPPPPPPLAEGHSSSLQFADWGAPVELSVEFRLLDPRGQLECPFRDDSLEVRARRQSFCNRVEGYGRICDCHQPSGLEFPPKPIGNSQLLDVPIVVLASNRPYYLYRMLRSLLEAHGVQPEMVTVFIDGFYAEPREICKLLNLRFVQNKPDGSRSARISHHYKTSLTNTFERLHPRAQFAILLEEDLDLARDALIYFNQTKRLLETDPSLYCVSAWNDQGYEHSVGDLRQLRRVETMPGLGWMLTRRLFEEELKGKWPSVQQQHDWDMWIRTPQVRLGRECLIPDVSRTYHFGSIGTNINSYFQRQYFSKHAFSDHLLGSSELIEFDQLNQMDQVGYEQQIESLLGANNRGPRRWFTSRSSSSSSIESNSLSGRNGFNETLAIVPAGALCALANGISNPFDKLNQTETNTLNVIFIKMIDSEDFANWLQLAKCWRLWDLDARGQHKSMWRLFVNGQQTLVIGHPASVYGSHKPDQVVPYNF